MDKIKNILEDLAKTKCFACNIKSQHNEYCLLLPDKEKLLSWYNDEKEEPCMLVGNNAFVRLDKNNVESILFQDISKFEALINPILFVISKVQYNLFRPVMYLLGGAAIGYSLWTYLSANSLLTLTEFSHFYIPFITLLQRIFIPISFIFGFIGARKVSKNIPAFYWKDFEFTSSLIGQLLGVFSVFMLLNSILSLVR